MANPAMSDAETWDVRAVHVPSREIVAMLALWLQAHFGAAPALCLLVISTAYAVRKCGANIAFGWEAAIRSSRLNDANAPEAAIQPRAAKSALSIDRMFVERWRPGPAVS